MKGSASRRDGALRIRGGSELAGELCVSGSKNAALPGMAAALLTAEPGRLTNVPKVTDTAGVARIPSRVGGRTEGGGLLGPRVGGARGNHGAPVARPRRGAT